MIRHPFIALLLASIAVTLVTCASNRSSPSGTNDPILDAELKEQQMHEAQLTILSKQVDSLRCINPRSSAQEEELRSTEERWEWHQAQWEESSRRAAERAKGNWNRICPIKRSSGFSCVEGR